VGRRVDGGTALTLALSPRERGWLMRRGGGKAGGVAVGPEGFRADSDADGLAVLAEPADAAEIWTIARHGSSYAWTGARG
jgi:hypothetical protein